MPRRRYRRRPPRSILVFVVVVIVVAVRVWYDLGGPSTDARSATALTEGYYDVVRVVDGDTLIVAHDIERDGGEQTVVRLIGVDTPETVKPGTLVEPFGPEASEFTRQFVSGGTVYLRLGRRRTDRYDRHLAFVFVGGRIDDPMLNEELVRAGLARVKIYAGEASSWTRRIERAEREARAARIGIWSRPMPATVP